MKPIIDRETNQVNYGIYDDLIDFNYQDFTLKNFWDKKVGWFKNKKTFKKFHFISFSNNEYIIGVAFVDVGLAFNVFGYVYHHNHSVITKWNKTIMKMTFEANPDKHSIKYQSKKIVINVEKDINQNFIKGHFFYKDKIDINYHVNLSLTNKPLRVLNPTDLNHWSFTAKRAGLALKFINLKINNNVININTNNTLVCTDWSAGYFNSSTNWIWGCAAVKIGNDNIGFNFCTLNNNALYPENAVWFNDERQHYNHILFKWNYDEPYKYGMKIYNGEKTIDLDFKPFGQTDDVHNRGLGLIKTNFHQFFGEYTGFITCNQRKIQIKCLGLFELHKSLW